MEKTPTPPSSDEAWLLNFLREHDAPCPGCGYNLRSLETPRCPECGQHLVLRVGLVHPKLAAFITGLVGLSAGAGLNGLLLIYVFIVSVFRGQMGGPPAWFVVFNTLGLLILGGGIGLWLIFGRRIRALPGAVRWSLAAACWVATLVDIVLFSFTIR